MRKSRTGWGPDKASGCVLNDLSKALDVPKMKNGMKDLLSKLLFR